MSEIDALVTLRGRLGDRAVFCLAIGAEPQSVGYVQSLGTRIANSRDIILKGESEESMTQRERSTDDGSRAEVYDTPARTVTASTPVMTSAAPRTDVETTVVTPVDRVRWGAIFAGLFSALSTLLVLTLLGIGIGAASFDPGDRASGFGIGAGIWSAVSLLLAFAVGGYVAARTAAVTGRRNGALNGALMWAVAIPLLLYALGSGVGALLGTAGRAATSAATVAGQAAAEHADNPALQATAGAATEAGQDAAANLQATAQALNTPENQQAVASGVRNAALGALLPLLLSLGAAALGGYLGSRDEGDRTTVGQTV